MSESESEDDEIEEVSEVYDTLRKDAKPLITDLVEGVSMWQSYSHLLLYLGLLGFFLAWITAFPRVLSVADIWVSGIAAAGLGITGVAASFWASSKYRRLKRKYLKLFEIASRLK